MKGFGSLGRKMDWVVERVGWRRCGDTLPLAGESKCHDGDVKQVQKTLSYQAIYMPNGSFLQWLYMGCSRFFREWHLTLFLLFFIDFLSQQGITREGRHKRRETGGRRAKFCKKRKFLMGRPAANTRIGEKRIHPVRARGGNMKFRALRLDSGNFSWGTEVCTRKVRVLDVTYNASNNELVRTKTLVKGAIVLIDAHPFKDWYESHYGVKVGVKKAGETGQEAMDLSGKSKQVQEKLKSRQKGRTLESALDHQFASGRILAKITSRPGQTGRCDGYILEGPELAFYQKAMSKK